MLSSFGTKVKTLESKRIIAATLVASLWLLLGILFLTHDPYIIKIIVALIPIILAFLSISYMQTVQRELKQRDTVQDIETKLKKKTKKMRELDQMKSDFVSIASHQLRSPLTSIMGYTSMLLEGSYGKLSAKTTEAVGRIAESSAYMATSIEDYLNVSRIDAGNMKYEFQDFNLKDETEHIADLKRREAIKKGLLITFKSDMGKHGIVHADIGKTKIILQNLIKNAITYTPRGTITIFVHDIAKKKKIYVDIIDSGIGMRPDELSDIFDKFERAHNASETDVTGTGLGLFVARKMAREMQGDVTAYSDGVGHGSTFRLEMPLQM